ncbi:S1 RNA-binding domain-containing protein [Candidatus Falkowbacteria bacterium]|nr:S1 RNA-binding domain-containing protein [Candidatus Falkowbacteria bacterium]
MAKKQIKVDLNSPMNKLIEDDKNVQSLPQVGDTVKGLVIAGSKKEVLLDINGVMTGIIRGKELYNESDEFGNLKVGDTTEATVMELENEQGLLELSFRFAGHLKTWSVLEEYKSSGETIPAKVTDANKGGLLITVNRVPGFLPVSQLSPEFYPRVQGGDKNKILEKLKSYIGQEFKVKVLDIDPDNEKLIASEKAAWEENQKDTLSQYKPGDLVDGKITAVTDFGVFVEFGQNLEGLIHISELAWQRIDNPSDLFKVGDSVKAEIIKVEGSKIFLSSKKLQRDPWDNINEKYAVGDVVEGEIIKSTPFGLFVKLDKDIHGLAHISELSNKKITNTEDFAKTGSTMSFKIVSIEPNEHRLGLSIKSMDDKDDKSEDKKAKEDKAEVVEDSKEESKVEEVTESKEESKVEEVTESKEEPKVEEVTEAKEEPKVEEDPKDTSKKEKTE